MLKIKNKIEFENNCWVGEVDSSLFNSSEEHRIKAVTDIASITRGRLGFKELDNLSKINTSSIGEFASYEDVLEAANLNKRKKLYNRLLTESAGKPSVPFEFTPIIYKNVSINQTEDYEFNKFSTVFPDFIFTNLRNSLVQNPSYIPLSSDIPFYWNFRIIIGRVPWKTISHIRTHRAFSFLVESSRNKKYLNNVEFHYPSWFTSGVNEVLYNHDLQTLTHFRDLVSMGSLKGEEATMELSDRRLVYFAMAAWQQDKNAWDNLFAVRGNNSGTMGMTSIVVNNIKQIINR